MPTSTGLHAQAGLVDVETRRDRSPRAPLIIEAWVDGTRPGVAQGSCFIRPRRAAPPGVQRADGDDTPVRRERGCAACEGRAGRLAVMLCLMGIPTVNGRMWHDRFRSVGTVRPVRYPPERIWHRISGRLRGGVLRTTCSAVAASPVLQCGRLMWCTCSRLRQELTFPEIEWRDPT